MEFIITQKTFKKNYAGELINISTYRRKHKSIMHANFDAKDMAEKLAKRKDIDDWSVEIYDDDGDAYTKISPTVGDTCSALFVFAMEHEIECYNQATQMMHEQMSNGMKSMIDGILKGELD